MWEKTAGLLAVPIGAVLAATLVWHGTDAAFTAQTSNQSNSVTAGNVAITDDDNGSAMFTATGLKPGSTGSKCIAVTYTGSLAASVKFFIAPGGLTDSGLASYLNLTVEEGTGGSFASCSGFSATSTPYNGTLANLASTSTNSATGLGSFSPTAANQSRTYRFTYTLADNNSAQGGSAQFAITWEASNT